MSGAFVLRLFGGLRLEIGDQRITRFPTKRSALILARLGLARGTAISRDELAELLWPDEYLDQTRLRLRQELRRLRSAVGELGNAIRTDRQWIEVDREILSTDVQQFDDAITQASTAVDPAEKAAALSRAVSLLEGPILSGFQEPWIVALRRDYDEKARRTWLNLAALHEATGNLEKALDANLHAVRENPLDLEANAGLIRRYVEAGQVARARQAYNAFDGMLYRELGRHAPPSLKEVLEQSAPGVEISERSLSPVRAAVSRPAPINGRSEILESIHLSLSRPGASVIVVGPIGVGKTHIIREAAWRFSRECDLPVHFGAVSGPVEDGLFLPTATSNADELMDAIADAAGKGWRVLAESRTRLNSDAAIEIRVDPLPCPSPSEDPAEVRANPAVQVLLSKVRDRATAGPEAQDLKELSRLAAALGGMPAALRAFAERLTFESPGQALQNFADGMTDYAQEALGSGETVQEAVAQLVNDLPGYARDLFCSLIWLEGVSSDLGAKLAEPHDPAEAWGLLERKCLVTLQDGQGPRRFSVPSPVAWIVRNRMRPEDQVRHQHRTWKAVADWAFHKSRLMGSQGQEYAFNSVQTELENLQKGLEWAIAEDPAIAGELVVGVWRTICARGNPSGYAELLLRAARTGAGMLPPSRAGEAWLGAALALAIGGQNLLAEDAFQRALKIFEDSNDKNGHAWAAINYAECIVASTDMRRATEMCLQAAQSTGNANDRWMGMCFYAMGLAHMGEMERAVQVAEETFAARLQSTDPTDQARAFGDLARLYQKVGRPEAAGPLLREGVQRLREAGVQDILFDTLLLLAEVSADAPDVGALLAEADLLAGRMGSNPRRLEVARARMTWASQQGTSGGFVAAVEDTFRFTQLVRSSAERARSLRALELGLRQVDKTPYANAIAAVLGDKTEGPVHEGWRALLRSDSHATVCVLAVAMAKEAVRG